MAKKAEIEQTEIEASYELPEGWKWCRLGELCEKIKRGKSPKYTEKSKTLVFAQKCNQPDGTMSLEKALFLNEELLSKYKDDDFVRDGDILINSTGTGTIGRVGYFDKSFLTEGMKLVPDTHVTTVRARIGNAPQFFYYFLKQKESYLELKGVGTTNMKELHADVLENLLFPLPPTLAEQKRIVSRIETLFAKLDEAEEKTRAVLDSFETRKAAILHKAFTGKLTANWRKENGVSDDSWEEKLFDSCIAKMQNGLSKRSGNEGVETVVLRLANIGECDFDVSDLRTIKLTSKEQENYSLTKDDVVMIRVNGSKINVGRQILVRNNEGWSFCDHIIRIKFETFCLPSYMVYFSNTKEYKDYIQDNMVSSAGQNTISRKGLSNLKLKIPTLHEQQEIIRILDTVLEKESRAKEAAQSVLDQIALLKKSILARAFRGEL